MAPLLDLGNNLTFETVIVIVPVSRHRFAGRLGRDGVFRGPRRLNSRVLSVRSRSQKQIHSNLRQITSHFLWTAARSVAEGVEAWPIRPDLLHRVCGEPRAPERLVRYLTSSMVCSRASGVRYVWERQAGRPTPAHEPALWGPIRTWYVCMYVHTASPASPGRKRYSMYVLVRVQ